MGNEEEMYTRGNGESTDEFEVKGGVHQGFVLSPLVFG